jgi:predicted AAA+ superfamily ATPase
MLEQQISELIPAFTQESSINRLFIDEITAIPNWEMALKRMADKGELRSILVVTTGSKATDLRRGSEKLPGRKGKLARTSYLFTPVSYREFCNKCRAKLGADTLIAYLLSGGSPIACCELAATGRIPEYVIELVKDWIEGEIAFSGRSRSSLFNIMSVIYRLGGTAIGQAKLAREAGLANNTTAAAYMEILQDLGCIVPAYSWDQHKKINILRKPCKYNFTNLLCAVVYHSARIRTVEDFRRLPEPTQGMWYEWLVAQELLRRSAIQGEEILMPLSYWHNKEHEIDFVDSQQGFIEIKRGKCSPLEFGWFTHQFPQQTLTVINLSKFTTKNIRGITLDDFLG